MGNEDGSGRYNLERVVWEIGREDGRGRWEERVVGEDGKREC